MAAISLFDFATYTDMFTSPRMAEAFGERATLARMVDVERAISKVQGELGIIPAAAAAHIVATLSADRLDLARLHADTLDVGRPVVGLQQQLAGQVGAEHAPWVHYGMTTYDIMDTGKVLQVRDGIDIVLAQLRVHRGMLADLARAHRDTVMMGRTNNLHALPITFGGKVAVWVEELLRHEVRILECRPRVEVVQFGGAAGTLASLGTRGMAFREAMAGELGLGMVWTNWHNARDAMTEICLDLSNLCATLARIAQNINQLSGTDIAEMSERGNVGRGRSSTLPHKKNPRAAEFAEAVARLGRHRGAGMLEVMGQEHDRCGGTYICEWMLLPETFLLTSGALAWGIDLLERLEIHPEKMRENVDTMHGLAMTERFTLALAGHIGKPQARRLIDEACVRTVDSNGTLVETLKAMPDVVAALGEAGIDELADPNTYVGAAPEMVDRVLAMHEAATKAD